jgi:hypothetical protein
MKWLSQLKDFIINLNERSRYLYGAAFVFTLFLLFGGLLYYYWSARDTLLRRIKRINQEREEIQAVIMRYATVQKQQQQVQALLTKDKNFLIERYFRDIVNELGLEQKNTKAPEITEEDLGNEYSRLKLSASFTGLSMQQLTELLYRLEKNPRVSLVELDILKTPKAPTVDSNIVIATLQPKASIPE